MSNQTIVFFSSDATNLYKNDIYRCVSLPIGYCVRFRYLSKYLWAGVPDQPSSEHHEQVKEKCDALVGKEGLVCFVSGNKGQDVNENDLKFHCLRRVKVLSCFWEEELDEFNFILELRGFETGQIDRQQGEVPPDSWVGRLDVRDKKKCKWINAVKSIEPHFPETLFFYLKSVKDEGTGDVLRPAFLSDRQHSHFELADGSSYVLQCVFYDPTGDKPINAEASGGGLAIVAPPRVGAIQDHKRIVLRTSSSSERSTDAVVYVRGNKDFFTELNWTITKSWRRTLKFCGLSFGAAIGTCLLLLARGNLRETVFSFVNAGLALLGAGMIAISAACLYHLFHKK